MIISASRRTDIPAFYSDWFIHRLKEGFVYVQNPFNQELISKVTLHPDLIECIVFWTKNPHPILNKLKEIDFWGYQYYFQFTLTAYDSELERNLPDKETIIKTFKTLSDTIGSEKIIWRYDPILCTDKITSENHIETFTQIAEALKGYTQRCITSFLDMYKKCEKNLKSIHVAEMNRSAKWFLLKEMKAISDHNGMTLGTCAEEIETDDLGISHGKCIDDALVSRIIGENIQIRKDPSQRKKCRCIESIDIGAYNTCMHHCLYCYANHSYNTVQKNQARHDIQSPLLIGRPKGTEKIVDRKMTSYRSDQLTLI